jgi:amino acid transporter
LGFGVITFTAKEMSDPARQLPRAVFIALGIATVIYVAVSLGLNFVLKGRQRAWTPIRKSSARSSPTWLADVHTG